jgi:type IV pilus assembly protein PilB
MPVSRSDHTLKVALADPFNVVAIDALHQVTGLAIEVVTAPERDILNCLELHYRTGDTIEQSIDKILEEKAEEAAPPLEEVLAQAGTRMTTRRSSGSSARSSPARSTAAQRHSLRAGRAADADSDARGRRSFPGCAHPEGDAVRRDDAHENRGGPGRGGDARAAGWPGDGSSWVAVQVNLRVSSLPTAFGENVVARILDPNHAGRDVDVDRFSRRK